MVVVVETRSSLGQGVAYNTQTGMIPPMMMRTVLRGCIVGDVN